MISRFAKEFPIVLHIMLQGTAIVALYAMPLFDTLNFTVYLEIKAERRGLKESYCHYAAFLLEKDRREFVQLSPPLAVSHSLTLLTAPSPLLQTTAFQKNPPKCKKPLMAPCVNPRKDYEAIESKHESPTPVHAPLQGSYNYGELCWHFGMCTYGPAGREVARFSHPQ